jgi:hypothetical protein
MQRILQKVNVQRLIGLIKSNGEEKAMPMVKGKKYPYTEEGKKKAKAASGRRRKTTKKA